MKEALNFLLTSGILINFLLAFLIQKKAEKALTEKILLALFLILAIVCISYHSFLNDLDYISIITFIPNEIAEWIISPLLFLLVHSLIKKRVIDRDLVLKLSIIPLLVLVFISIPLFVSLFNKELELSHIRYLSNHAYLYVFISAAYSIVFMILSLKVIAAAKKKQVHYFSGDRLLGFRWIEVFLWAIIIVFIVDVSTSMYELTIEELDWDSSYLTISVLIVFIVYLAYFGTNESKMLLPDFVWQHPSIPKIQTEVDLPLQKQLESIMSEQKVFRNQELTLSDLAERIEVSDKKLSALLNRQMNITFYDFVNNYRLADFEQLALSDKIHTTTIFGLAQESGFKSKATFNRLFKQKHGLTPSKFLKK